MPTKSLRERAEDSLSGAYIRGYHKGQKDFAEKVRAEIEESKKPENVPYEVEYWDYIKALDTALRIIDKHIGG